MIHLENETSPWSLLFSKKHASLSRAAQILLLSGPSDELVLARALAALEGSMLRESFSYGVAMRTVVKIAIAMNLEMLGSQTRADAGTILESARGLTALPWQERAVYFLRDELQYSRRDTALLLRITDANVDQLLKFARKRVRRIEHVASISLKRCLADSQKELHLA